MKINPDGWFVRNFLDIPAHKNYMLPKTVCDLTKKIISSLFAWSVWISFLLLATALILSVIYAVLVKFGMSNFLNYNDKNLSTLFGFALGVVLAIIVVVVFALLIMAYEKIKQKIEDASYAEPSPGAEYTRGLIARVKDKTCVMIDYGLNSEERNRGPYY